jgi:hypothetical protein
MSKPVELSDEIVADARRTAAIAARSIADQIELWAQLGRAIEPLLDSNRVLTLRQAGGIRPLSECLASVDTEEGRQRVRDYLTAQPFPHYEPDPDTPGLLVRIDANGARTVGRFIGRDFQAAK